MTSELIPPAVAFMVSEEEMLNDPEIDAVLVESDTSSPARYCDLENRSVNQAYLSRSHRQSLLTHSTGDRPSSIANIQLGKRRHIRKVPDPHAQMIRRDVEKVDHRTLIRRWKSNKNEERKIRIGSDDQVWSEFGFGSLR